VHLNKGKPILGWYHKESPQGMVKEPKWPNHFPRSFPLNVFTTIIYFILFLSISCLNIWLEVYFGIKNGNFKKIVFLIEMSFS
jgi:hypothetical protein